MDHVLNFGKHKGKSLSEVRSSDPQYIPWLAAVGVRKDHSVRTHDQYSSIQIKDPYAIQAARVLSGSSGPFPPPPSKR